MVQEQDAALGPLVVGGAPPLALMPRLFTWEPSHETLNQIRGWYLDWARRAVPRMFEEIGHSDATTGRQLHTYFEELPDWAAIRFLSAPEICRRVRDWERDRENFYRHVPFFVDSLRAERILSGTQDGPKPCWSALGDFYFAGSESVDPRRQQWNPSASFAAPRVGGVPIDLTSPHCHYVNSMADCPFEPYTPGETTAFCANLETALGKILFVRESAGRLFTTFTSVIVARKNPLRPKSAGSSSTPSHVGRLLLRNAHLMDIARLAESLVHESIHAILEVQEVSQTFADHPEPPNPDVPVRSPWTNNEIPRRIYVQACFVWYGLVKFWKAALQTDAFPLELVNKHLAIALSGFKVADPVDRLLPYRDAIRPDALEVTASLRSELESSHDLYYEAGDAA